jgi:hypothetical protein
MSEPACAAVRPDEPSAGRPLGIAQPGRAVTHRSRAGMPVGGRSHRPNDREHPPQRRSSCRLPDEAVHVSASTRNPDFGLRADSPPAQMSSTTRSTSAVARAAAGVGPPASRISRSRPRSPTNQHRRTKFDRRDAPRARIVGEITCRRRPRSPRTAPAHRLPRVELRGSVVDTVGRRFIPPSRCDPIVVPPCGCA